jgi:ATP-dependent helicase HrpA
MKIDFKAMHADIDRCLRVDQHRLRNRLRKIRDGQKRAAKPAADKPETQTDTSDPLQSLQRAITQSQQNREHRHSNLPVPTYPQELPVVDCREQIIDSVRKHPVTIVCGETGSGKTTQIPKMCLEAGLGVSGLIGHTQPRRIAARTVSARIAAELKTELGGAVGYKVRFGDKISRDSYIKLMTDGILLAEIQSDPWLNQYDAIIVDEAHERSLNIDFILGYLKRLLQRRRDLKVIITSATIDPDTFSRHFDNAPVILAEGRTYPVELRYRPWKELEDDDRDQPQAVFEACEELAGLGAGDTLVFLPGERDIRECADYIGKAATGSKRLRGVEVLPLLARLSAAEQAKVFEPHGRRRIVLATNVAETSLTVPGIRYVVDSGDARMSRYSVRSKVQRLPIEKVSQASANQRKGRCGREAPGVCIRLYSEEDFDARSEFTDPEILRTNLASVILQMEVSRLGHVEDFPFVEAPDSRFVNDGYRLLIELGAVSEKRKLTSLGKRIARLPIDPRLARMLIEGGEEGSVSEVLTIVSALSVQDPRERPLAKQQAADELHAEFNDKHSDFNSILNLWEFCRVQGEALSNSKFRKMCKQRYLSYLRIREWRDIRRQLAQLCRELGMTENTSEAGYDKTHRALLSGLLGNVALKDNRNDYLATRNRKVMIFPGSAVFGKGPKWMMAAEISETTRLYARGVAAIKPEWAEALGEHLLKHSYFGATWHRKRAQVGAFRKSTLYGLVLVEKKKINYGPINPEQSREIFIRDALVAGNYNTRSDFFHHNLKLVDEVVTLEEKTRRRDILIDPEELYSFYNQRIPESIYSGPQFEKWREEYEREHPRGLWLTREFLMQNDELEVSKQDFPDQLEFNGVVLPLHYHFHPGAEDDGVSLHVPVSLLNRITAEQCEWLVPGLLEEKIVALIKSLPKTLRRNFVPAPDYAQKSIAGLALRRHESLTSALSSELQAMTSVKVSAVEWQTDQLPAHLVMRIVVTESDGSTLDVSRDVELLQDRYADRIEQSLAQTADNSFERTDLSDWNFGDLPESIEIETQGVMMQGFPALVEEDDCVSLRVLATAEGAAAKMPAGLRALYRRQLQQEVKYLIRNLPGIDVLCLRFAVFGKSDVLKRDIVDAALDRTFIHDQITPRSREEFVDILETQKSELVGNANAICAVLAETFEAHREITRRMSGSVSLSWVEPSADIKDQISRMIYPGFVSATPPQWLARLPVYFKAIARRFDSLDREPDRDRRRRAEMLPVWERIKTAIDDPVTGHQMLRLRWLFEELRVSVFAQDLGTAEKVSLGRVETQLEKILSS